MNGAEDLRLLLASRCPLATVASPDESRLLAIIRVAAAAAGLPLWVWSNAHGLVRDGGAPAYDTTAPPKALDHMDELAAPGVFVFADAQHALDDVIFVRRLKERAMSGQAAQIIVLASPNGNVPTELQGLATVWSLPAPSRHETDALVRTSLDELRAKDVPVTLDDDAMSELINAVRGLSSIEAEQLIRQAALNDGTVNEADVAFLRDKKAGALSVGGVLEIVQPDAGSLDAVGGLEHLKEWLVSRGRAFEPAAAKFGLEAPRGVLVTGVPGCGKSLVAKTLARTWSMPLVLLDTGRLFGAFLGESESRLRAALASVEAMAPVVLWIDEIEKGFARSSGASDGGVGERVLGTFLRWMQEHPAGVFVIATSNDVRALPPEFLRKGRFDEIFFVDLPGAAERRQIFALQLTRRGRDPKAFDLAAIAKATDGFSGAEIEAAVSGALYRAYGAGHELSTADLLAEADHAVPLSRTRAEDVAAMRAWAAERAVHASANAAPARAV